VTRKSDSGSEAAVAFLSTQISHHPLTFFAVTSLAVVSFAVASFAIASFLDTIICGGFSLWPSGSTWLALDWLGFASSTPLSDFFLIAISMTCEEMRTPVFDSFGGECCLITDWQFAMRRVSCNDFACGRL